MPGRTAVVRWLLKGAVVVNALRDPGQCKPVEAR